MSNFPQYIPPKWAVKLLHLFCDRQWLGEILGDLQEQYDENRAKYSRFKASILYWWEVIRFIRPHIFKPFFSNSYKIMPFHHLKVSWRHLQRNKVYGLINILGLSVGIASVLLIALYVRSELSFDKFFDDSERIHRIALHRIYPDRTRDFASSVITLAPVLKENYPEVEEVTRMHRLFFANEISVNIEDDTYIETRFRVADEDFFKVFSHKFIHGDPLTALDAPDKVVLSASTAQKYFGTTDVLNKTLQLGGDTSLTIISGVIEDIPVNSHIHFDLMASLHSIGYLEGAIESNSWINPWVYTYVKLKEGINPKDFEEKIAGAVETHGTASISQQLGPDYKEAGHKFEYFLQPITDIHLHSQIDIEVEPNSDITYIYLLSLIAIIILVISSINYINLSVARSPARAREVGIRKVVGVHRINLIGQFLTEAIFICTLSAILAVGLTALCLPYFNQLLNTTLTLQPLLQPVFLLVFLGFILFTGILSGFYPALVIAAIQPARILKGSFKNSKKGLWMRNGLTSIQFIISMIMISGSVLVHQQMNYFQNKNLGFDDENILIIQQMGSLGDQFESFKNEIKTLPEVQAVGSANGLPGDFHGSGVFKTDNPEASDLRANTATFDDDFFEAMNFELDTGRTFSPEFNDSLSIIINEAAVRALGLTNPLGERFRNAGNQNNANADNPPVFKVIGVVKDYHFYSLHTEIGPIVIFNTNGQFFGPRMAVRVRSENMHKTINELEAIWNKMTQAAFNYSFLKQDLNQQYESDRRTAFLFDIFTWIAIIMCCTGLFALATFIAQQRQKEMSIRKVLGASTSGIMLSFSREFMILILIAFLIGVPIAYYAMQSWLTNFAYHIEISVSTFLLTAGLMILLVILTLSYQAVKLGRINPAEWLRNE